MKRVVFMVSLSLFSRLLVAQDLDAKSLVGDNWYGAYFNGQKVGYSLVSVKIERDETVSFIEDAHFKIKMSGVAQEMSIYAKRSYAKTGELLGIQQKVDDGGGVKTFEASVHGEKMTLATTIGTNSSAKDLPKPKESLRDALKQSEIVRKGANVGDELPYSVFEPMYGRELAGVSKIEAVEDRVLEGVNTKVFKVRSSMPDLGVDSVASVAQDGTILEDHFGDVITLRLEPKEMAQDVSYRNDVIVSNAAAVDKKIEDPRGCEALTLKLFGPLPADRLINEERQQMTPKQGYVEFLGKRNVTEGFHPAKLPISEPSLQEWLKPTTFVQSADPRLIAKAKEIVNGETDTFAVSTKLCNWTYSNVRTTYSARLSNALEVLEQPEGDCTEHSILFVGLARAAGLPAREVAGLIYVYEDGKPAFYFHQWAKVWIGKWIDVDPTFNQPLADATHIKLAEGDLFEQAKLIPTIGQLRAEVLDEQERIKK